MPADYYSLLGLARDASGDDVRRAYRKAALRLHPDRAGAASSAEFAAVSEAHEVLADPWQREVYDAFGHEGLALYAGAYKLARAGGARGNVLPPLMLAGTAVLGSGALALVLAAFLSLAGLKADGVAPVGRAPWWLLFAPLWIFADPLLALMLALVNADGPGSLRASLARLLPACALLVAFQVLLCVRLGGSDPDGAAGLDTLPAAAAAPLGPGGPAAAGVSWLVVFSPLLVGRGAALAGLPASLDERRRAAARRATAAATAAGSPLGRTLRDGAWVLLSSLQLSVLPPMLDGVLDCRWGTALGPLHAYLLLEALLTASLCVRTCLAGADSPYEADADERGTPQEQLRLLWRQGGRILWLGAVGVFALVLSWAADALEASEAGSAPTSDLLLGPAAALGGYAACVGLAAAWLLCGRRGPRQADPGWPEPAAERPAGGGADGPPSSRSSRSSARRPELTARELGRDGATGLEAAAGPGFGGDTDSDGDEAWPELDVSGARPAPFSHAAAAAAEARTLEETGGALPGAMPPSFA